jgi:cytochrome oxidase Cu insertion factor (SCO1/SenC/PrrC family)
MRSRSLRRWSIALAAAAVVGGGVGGAAALLTRGSGTAVGATKPVASWPAGVKRAPDFRLRDQNGRPVSLRSSRGRVTIVSFIDPVCRNLCPLEAQELDKVAHDLHPAIVAVSVNPWNDTQSAFRADAHAWRLPREWRWGVGSYRALARVWRQYEIAVQVQRKTIAGVTVHEVGHTEAAYVVDRQGYQRALFVYPFRARDIEEVVRSL